MQRTLALLAVAEALVIVGLLLALLSSGGGAQAAVPGGAPAVERAGEAREAAAEVPGPGDPPTPQIEQRVAAVPATGTAMPGTVLYGRVLGPDGEPVTNGVVTAIATGQTLRGLVYDVDDARGYALPALETGNWTLACRAESFTPYEQRLEIGGGGFQQHDIRLARAHLLRVAFVAPDGRPLAAALAATGATRRMAELTAVATYEPPPDSFPMTTQRTVSGLGEGRWRRPNTMAERFAGQFELDRAPPIWVSAVYRHVVVGKSLAQAGHEEVEVRIDPSALPALHAAAKLQVLDAETRLPVAGAVVEFGDRQGMGLVQKSAGDGTVTCAGLPPGILELTIGATDYERYHRFVRIEPGSALDLGPIALDPNVALAGTLVDVHGKPVPGVGVNWYRLDRYGPDVPLSNGFGIATDAEGRFRLWGCGRGRYLIRAAKGLAAAAAVVADTSAGPIEDLRVQLVPCADVRLENQMPRTMTCLVTIRRQDGIPIHSDLVRPANWKIHPVPLPPGPYTVEIRDDRGALLRSFPIDAGAQPVTIRVP